MWIADGWKDYEVIDCSGGEKLERWGKYILVRPDPQVIWDTDKKAPQWRKMNGHYHRSSKGGGEWEFFSLPEQWSINYKGLTYADSLVALTGLDEENIFLALYGKLHSNAKLIAKVNKIAFDDVIDSFGIDSIIYPKYLTADYILQYVRARQNTIGCNVETLYKILDGRAEALEFSIKEDSAVTNVPLMDLNLKDNLLICCINRNGQILTPRGQNIIKVGDTVILVTTNRGLGDIRDILKS